MYFLIKFYQTLLFYTDGQAPELGINSLTYDQVHVVWEIYDSSLQCFLVGEALNGLGLAKPFRSVRSTVKRRLWWYSGSTHTTFVLDLQAACISINQPIQHSHPKKTSNSRNCITRRGRSWSRTAKTRMSEWRAGKRVSEQRAKDMHRQKAVYVNWQQQTTAQRALVDPAFEH